MASTAISAQGAVLSIGTGSGGAKTISGVTVGYPTLLTATAHGFNNGDVVALAALTGADAASLNGLTVTVKYKSTNAFYVDVDTTGKTITPGSGTATPAMASRRRILPAIASLVITGSAKWPSSSRLACLCCNRSCPA